MNYGGANSNNNSINGGSGESGSKTTVFLSDGGFADGGIPPPSSSASRIYMTTAVAGTSTSALLDANNNVGSGMSAQQLHQQQQQWTLQQQQQIQQYPGHHRDKLSRIRDSLKPFEAAAPPPPSVATMLPNYYLPSSSSSSPPPFEQQNDEPSEEIQRIMINALTQGGYDPVSAYYALKLVNFNSVMDAAKVLSSIKQNLQHQSSYGAGGASISNQQQQQQQGLQHQQQQWQSTTYSSGGGGSAAMSLDAFTVGSYGVNNNNNNNNNGHSAMLNANLLSSNGRAALSRYGVVTDANSNVMTTVSAPQQQRNQEPPIPPTTISISNSSGNTVFRPKLYVNVQKEQHQQQALGQQHRLSQQQAHNLSTTKFMPLVMTTGQQQQLTVNEYGNSMGSSSPTIDDTVSRSNPTGGGNTKSRSNSPTLTGSLIVDLNSPSSAAVVGARSPASGAAAQQKPRRPRLCQMTGYQRSHTQFPHTVLRHSNSFDPADQVDLEPAGTQLQVNSTTQQQQTRIGNLTHQGASGTVIRIERNASERIQPSSTAGGGVNFLTRGDDATSSSEMERGAQYAIARLTLSGRNADAEGLRRTSSSATTTTFLPTTQRRRVADAAHNGGGVPNASSAIGLAKDNGGGAAVVGAGGRLCTATAPQTYIGHGETSSSAVQCIVVDPDDYQYGKGDRTAGPAGRAIAEPPRYGNYIEQVRRTTYIDNNAGIQQQQQQKDRQMTVNGNTDGTSASAFAGTQCFSASSTTVGRSTTTTEVEHAPPPQAPAVQRCVSPLPASVARRVRSGTYERYVKPCKAVMFRFFMEQHIEKHIQQYRERNQRELQLTKEMEAAELPDSMKQQMLRLLRQKESKYIRLKRQKMNKNMFDMIRHIGVGAFGKVTLVKKKDTGNIYAMKTLSKEDVIQKQQAAHVKAERDILAEANSPWIVKLFFSFQDAANLYFIMEYVPGGDMMQLLINKGIFTERLARFYVAELTCAIEYVHSLGFIHRDIKPDNILIDKKGHIKLTDFGLCTGLRWTHDKRHYVIYDDDVPGLAQQHVREDSFTLPPHLANSKEKVKLLELRHHKKRNQAHSVVGTGNYMAPEVIKKTGHTQLCDWWSVGVILYEMVYGRPPFMSQNENPGETQFMIVNWRRFLDLHNPMGARLSRNCVDIIRRLCCDEQNRLGIGGASEIKAHSWFMGIDFNTLRSTKAEYIPRVEHDEDTSNFDTFEVNGEELFKTSMQQANGGKAFGAGPAGQPYNPAFFDFTFRHFFVNEAAAVASGGHGGAAAASGFRSSYQQRPGLGPLIEQASRNDAAAAAASEGSGARLASQMFGQYNSGGGVDTTRPGVNGNSPRRAEAPPPPRN